MQEHVVSKCTRSRGRHESRMEARSRLTPNIFGRTPVHEARGKLDVWLDKFHLWCEAETILGSRRVCLVHCHT